MIFYLWRSIIRAKSWKQTKPSPFLSTSAIMRRQSSKVHQSSPIAVNTLNSSSADIFPSWSVSNTSKASLSSSSEPVQQSLQGNTPVAVAASGGGRDIVDFFVGEDGMALAHRVWELEQLFDRLHGRTRSKEGGDLRDLRAEEWNPRNQRSNSRKIERRKKNAPTFSPLVDHHRLPILSQSSGESILEKPQGFCRGWFQDDVGLLGRMKKED